MNTELDIDNLLIIGNGFDIDLGLKTTYKDFLGSPSFSRYADHN